MFLMFGNNSDYDTFYNIYVPDYGGYLARGSGCNSECFDWSFINIEATGYAYPGMDSSGDLFGLKFWDHVTNVFLVDSIMDANPDAWGQGLAVNNVYAMTPAQCSRNWTIKNNVLVDWEHAISVPAGCW